MDIMIDLETLSTSPTAQIIQIGAVIFEPVSGGKILADKGFNMFIEPDGKYTIDKDTIIWWLQQPNAKKMGEALEEHAVSLWDALMLFEAWPIASHQISWDAIGHVWAKPASFDFPILEHAYRSNGHRSAPWAYNKTRDVRTVFDILNGGSDPEIDTTGFTLHNALDDAIIQAMQLQKAFGGRR